MYMKEYENLSFRSAKGPKRANSCIYRYERDKNVKTEWEGLWAVVYGSHSRDKETLKIQTVFSQFSIPGVFFQLKLLCGSGLCWNHRLFSYGVYVGKAL